ncbi:zinc finger and BTB domain-containing protein 16-A-like [Myxocyprinus asiaticus]|uniref:zinc finger and BTB domain-containing protein 16-A-like n=1 Tax=Myxocyprinus asiaticus TaxID=70543 RepID=UPI002222634B|nr:zinc finger and BTB domain-containing protein 16-A-like [Myxocyprinus asiaticus]XP_051535644.1 zinc finger and BTB domain-containing protein 16-A-like [Myxocyprinus asiaticus]
MVNVDRMDLTKMGAIHLQNPGHPTSLLQKANQMRLSGTLCDVVIMVDSQEFHAHRTVLACASKMFEILFHRNSQHYTLDFLSPKTFQQILEYAYTATLQAKLEDLDDLLYAAEILEIEYLEEQCLKILETIQVTEENDTDVNMNENRAEDVNDRRIKYLKSTFIMKKHSIQDGGYGNAARHHLALVNMVDKRSSDSAQLGLPTISPTNAAIEGLMSMGQSTFQGNMPQTFVHKHGSASPLLDKIKTEMMQVDEEFQHECIFPRNEEGGSDSGQHRDTPGTPTRSSVITSARELHSADSSGDSQGDGSQVGLVNMASLAERHFASLCSIPSNYKSEGMLPLPVSMASSLNVPSSLAMSMDFSAYGGLFHQSLIQREFLSKLGANVKHEAQTQKERCEVCDMELPDNEATEQHKKLHGGVKTFGCEFCGKQFLDSLRLRMHILSHSAGPKALVCDQCGAQFSKEDVLEAHRQTHTGSDMAVFCLLCGKRFQTQKALQQHMEIHAGMRSYICSECERTFPSHTALKRHLRSHTGDHPFECEFCGSCFRDESTLKGHKRIHTGEKPYECNGCGKKFSLKHQLETHYRVHTGEKPFECKLCHQRSRDYSAMIKHLRTHNGASPYQCTICQENCPSLSSMQKHMKGHKPEDIPPDWRIEKTYLYLCYV